MSGLTPIAGTAVDLSAAADTKRAEEIQKRLLAAQLATTTYGATATPVAATVWLNLADTIFDFITVD